MSTFVMMFMAFIHEVRAFQCRVQTFAQARWQFVEGVIGSAKVGDVIV